MQHENVTYVISDLLCFIQNSFQRYPRDEINSAIVDFYNSEETTAAKEILANVASTIGLEREVSEFVPVRRSVRKAASADSLVVKDILDIWNVMDSKATNLPVFLAKNCTESLPLG